MAVSDGTHTYVSPPFPPPATLLFGNAPEDQLELVLRDHNLQPEQWTQWKSPYICMLVNTGDHRVLVDTGAGSRDPDAGKLIQNLRVAGIAPEEIDLVILTHNHPDHIGGNTLKNGQLAFPNARYAMLKDEWDFWTSEDVGEKLNAQVREVFTSVTCENLPPIKDRLELIEGEGEILPGIKAISAAGHTPGHMALLISSEGDQLLYISDLVLHPIHLEQPEWCAVFDFAPDQVVATRRRLLNRAASEKWLLHAFHFPFPGLGHVIEKGEGWSWQRL